MANLLLLHHLADSFKHSLSQSLHGVHRPLMDDVTPTVSCGHGCYSLDWIMQIFCSALPTFSAKLHRICRVRWRRSLLRILLLYLGSLKMKNSLACSRMCNCVKLSSVAYKIQELMTSDFKLYFLVLLLCFTWCAVRSCTPPVISFWWLFLDIIFCRGLSCLY